MKRVGITDSGARGRRSASTTLGSPALEQYAASLTPEQRSRLAAALADLPHKRS